MYFIVISKFCTDYTTDIIPITLLFNNYNARSLALNQILNCLYYFKSPRYYLAYYEWLNLIHLDNHCHLALWLPLRKNPHYELRPCTV